MTRAVLLAAAIAGVIAPSHAAVAQQRPMTFLDLQHLRRAGSPDLSPDGRWMLYTLSVPDWQAARRDTDIWLVSTSAGVSSARQLTFTPAKSENDPHWSRDGRFFVFSSDRDGSGAKPPDQLYVMRPDGGEARRVTDAKDGVGRFELSRDGRWLVYEAGKAEDRQLWALPVAGLLEGDAKPVQVTTHPTPIVWWTLTKDGAHLFFSTRR